MVMVSCCDGSVDVVYFPSLDTAFISFDPPRRAEGVREFLEQLGGREDECGAFEMRAGKVSGMEVEHVSRWADQTFLENARASF